MSAPVVDEGEAREGGMAMTEHEGMRICDAEGGAPLSQSFCLWSSCALRGHSFDPRLPGVLRCELGGWVVSGPPGGSGYG